MADEKRVSIVLPVDVHAAAKAVAEYPFGFFQLWPESEDVWRGVGANSVGRALAWFVKFGMDHARTCIDRELNEQQKMFNQQRQIVDFLLDRPGKDSARKSDFPQGSHDVGHVGAKEARTSRFQPVGSKKPGRRDRKRTGDPPRGFWSTRNTRRSDTVAIIAFSEERTFRSATKRPSPPRAYCVGEGPIPREFITGSANLSFGWRRAQGRSRCDLRAASGPCERRVRAGYCAPKSSRSLEIELARRKPLCRARQFLGISLGKPMLVGIG